MVNIMNPKLLKYVDFFLKYTEKNGFVLEDEKEISYGVKLSFRHEDENCSVNFYYSDKKGITSLIKPNKKNEKSSEKLQKIIHAIEHKIKATKYKHSQFIGTDESGKGDFFGPLVAAGIAIKQDEIPYLIEIGVNDSKLIRDDNIEIIFKKIYKRFSDRINVIILTPAKYNEMYEKFRSQNKKLNELLAWMHSRIIVDLSKKTGFKTAYVDKFTHDYKLKSSLKEIKDIELINFTKGEDNPAVAAASIIARYHVVSQFRKMSEKYQINFPKGASNQVITAGKLFASKYGKERMNEVAKLHFVTINKI